MFPVARAVLLSMCERVRILHVLKIVCGWASKTWLLPYACCGLHFIDSAACVLSSDHSTPLQFFFFTISFSVLCSCLYVKNSHERKMKQYVNSFTNYSLSLQCICNNINNKKQNHVCRDYFKYIYACARTHTHTEKYPPPPTHTHTHTNILTIHSLIYTT